ncbi:hypothetical protein TeGR_g6464 [Tetraparma gracilis]|uniref:Uncharacterized protein n=1 Tax=Tetraparma gracilis TaxID=2962635 RepID=A0ABQ6MHQ6_9STRA|nr:hypothetical protein TeGR_g6464 [Tetraparma gracilis]
MPEQPSALELATSSNFSELSDLLMASDGSLSPSDDLSLVFLTCVRAHADDSLLKLLLLRCLSSTEGADAKLFLSLKLLHSTPPPPAPEPDKRGDTVAELPQEQELTRSGRSQPEPDKNGDTVAELPQEQELTRSGRSQTVLFSSAVRRRNSSRRGTSVTSTQSDAPLPATPTGEAASEANARLAALETLLEEKEFQIAELGEAGLEINELLEEEEARSQQLASEKAALAQTVDSLREKLAFETSEKAKQMKLINELLLNAQSASTLLAASSDKEEAAKGSLLEISAKLATVQAVREGLHEQVKGEKLLRMKREKELGEVRAAGGVAEEKIKERYRERVQVKEREIEALRAELAKERAGREEMSRTLLERGRGGGCCLIS